MPAGVLVTVPVPDPDFVTVRLYAVGSVRSNVAVTVFALSTVTAQVPVPVQAPDQPLNFEPLSGVAVKVTAVPGAYPSLQSRPQLMPLGALVIVPVPLPAFVTVRLKLL